MQIGQTSPEDFQVFGLGDDGMLYEWKFAVRAKARLIKKDRYTYPRDITCWAGDPELDKSLIAARKSPDEWDITFHPGQTAGWMPCANEKVTPQVTEHPLKYQKI
jgi:hypothetical protein